MFNVPVVAEIGLFEVRRCSSSYDLKPSHGDAICKMLLRFPFGDTILHGGVTRFRTQPTYHTLDVSEYFVG